MRSDAQITADLRAAYEAMEVEAKKPSRKYPCVECRWNRGGEIGKCHNPLVKQFRKPDWNYDRAERRRYVSITDSRLCGPEKALWQPKLTLCERIISFFTPSQKG